MSSSQATIRVQGPLIYVHTHPEHKDRIKPIDGARWEPDTKAWTLPADPGTALELKQALSGIGKVSLDDGIKSLWQAAADLARMAQQPVVEPEPAVFTGPDPRTPMWEHQRRAVAKALHHKGYYLAHDMGAGKTLSALALVLKRDHQRILVFCPKRVISSWDKQIRMHTDLIPCPLTKGTTAQKAKTAQGWLDQYSGVVVIVNYEALVQDAFYQWTLKQEWDIIICDEAHRIKAPGGKISQRMSTLGKRADYRLCLSGTPFAHGPIDIYGQFRFLAPDVFGTSFTRFKNQYAVMNPKFPSQVVQYKNLEDLNAKFYSLADRVETRDVVDLPDERDEVLNFELSAAARKIYEDIAYQFWAEVDTITQTESGDLHVDSGEVTIQSVLTKILRMQQITSGFVKDDEGVIHQVDSGKADLLEDFMVDFPSDEPLVLFAKFAHDLDTIRRVCVKSGRSCGEVSGRHDDYARWQSGEINTIAIQLQAGGEGLNDLVTARYCIYYSVDHSLKNFVQSRARLVRPGQTRNVIFYHLIGSNTIEEDIYAALSKRQDLVQSLLERKPGASR